MDAWEAHAAGAVHGTPQRAGRGPAHLLHQGPTGGGKTLLATQILGSIYRTILRDRNGAGLVLWVVPSSQIYRDTLRRLRDRGDMYRLMLEHAVSRRIEVWEKQEIARLSPARLARMPQYPGDPACQHQSGNQGATEVLPRQRREHRPALSARRRSGGAQGVEGAGRQPGHDRRGRSKRAVPGGNVDRQSRANLPAAGDFGRGAQGHERPGAADHRGVQRLGGRGAVGHAEERARTSSAA